MEGRGAFAACFGGDILVHVASNGYERNHLIRAAACTPRHCPIPALLGQIGFDFKGTIQ